MPPSASRAFTPRRAARGPRSAASRPGSSGAATLGLYYISVYMSTLKLVATQGGGQNHDDHDDDENRDDHADQQRRPVDGRVADRRVDRHRRSWLARLARAPAGGSTRRHSSAVDKG